MTFKLNTLLIKSNVNSKFAELSYNNMKLKTSFD